MFILPINNNIPTRKRKTRHANGSRAHRTEAKQKPIKKVFLFFCFLHSIQFQVSPVEHCSLPLALHNCFTITNTNGESEAVSGVASEIMVEGVVAGDADAAAASDVLVSHSHSTCSPHSLHSPCQLLLCSLQTQRSQLRPSQHSRVCELCFSLPHSLPFRSLSLIFFISF